MQSSAPKTLTIGTRGSPLALKQAEEVRDRLVALHGLDPEAITIVPIKTSGDRIQDRPLSEIGGKGLFIKEIEQALHDGRIDFAVHSAKDMPTIMPKGMELTAFLPREDVRDVFLSLIAKSPDHLPEGARIGTSSLRRGAQMKRFRPDFRVVDFRGNVGTRVDKLARGVADATLLARAGLNRLGEEHRTTLILDPEQFPPAPAQGAICIETREDNTAVRDLVAPLNDTDSATTVAAERAFLNVLDGSCRTPIGAYTTLDGDRLRIKGQILAPDGSESYEDVLEGERGAAAALGAQLGEKLVSLAGRAFITRLNTGQGV